MDKRFVISSFAYALLGLALGIYMAASKNHEQLVTHAHIMLLGFVVSFTYGVCHKLWLNNSHTKLSHIQFYLHQAGTLLLLIALFLLYGKFASADTLEPLLSVGSITVFISLLLMSILMLRAPD